MQLKDIDIKLLHYLHAVKVASYKQIHRDIYSDYLFRSACNRLIKISHLGLISGYQNRLSTHDGKLISLTKKGFKQFVSKEDDYRVELKSDAVDHDLSLVDIRSQFLSTQNVKRYYTENEIQSWWYYSIDDAKKNMMRLNSDAMMQVNIKNRLFWAALEYESSLKVESRYEPIVKRIYSVYDVNLVFYICSSKSILKKIMATEKRLFDRERPKLFYQLMQNLNPHEALRFSNFNGFELVLEPKATDEQVMIQ